MQKVYCLVYMLDFNVMQMRKVNREEGYYPAKSRGISSDT